MDVKGVDFAVDSSKHIDWVIDHTRWAPENGINVYNFLIWKSPVDLAYSWWKRGDYDRWRSYYLRYHYQALFSGLDFYTVHYDDLVDDPSGVLSHICELIGMPYFQGKEYFWNYDHAMMGNNSAGEFRKTTISDEFAPLAREVAAYSTEDRSLQRVLELLRQRDVTSISVPRERVSHTYSPSVLSSVAYRLYRGLKLPWLRFRWNVVEPYFGPLGSTS